MTSKGDIAHDVSGVVGMNVKGGSKTTVDTSKHIICESRKPLVITGEHISESTDYLEARVKYASCCVQRYDDKLVALPVEETVAFRTKMRVPKVGIMMVGLGGNNGTSFAAGLEANRMRLSWETEYGTKSANWLGSMAMMGTLKVGQDSETGADVFVPIRNLLPLIDPNTLVLGGWDISGATMSEALRRAQVIPLQVQHAVGDILDKTIKVLPGVYNEDFIATNQKIRADHIVKEVEKEKQLQKLRKDIQEFKKSNGLEKVIVVWSGNTERFSEHITGVHDTAANLLAAIKSNHSELAPSLLYATAAVLEGCSYINGSPQNTFCDALVELARDRGVYMAGDDLKTGQTKLKSVLADFLVSTALKPTSIASYNHLGNNDGLNLSSEKQFRSKEISKASVVDDMIASNNLLYPSSEEHPDHCIVIKYVPAVGDSKRALDEYSADIFMNGQQTFVIHNTCQDSLLATPIILDLITFMELFERVEIKREADSAYHKLHTLNSLLSLFCKAPAVPPHSPVVNALFPQKEALVNFIRAAAGLPPTDYICLVRRSRWKASPSFSLGPSAWITRLFFNVMASRNLWGRSQNKESLIMFKTDIALAIFIVTK